jgi:DNA modification methylase
MQALGVGDDTLVDVEFVKLTPDEERKALLLLDASSELATVDAGQLTELVRDLSWSSSDLESFGQQMLLEATGNLEAVPEDDDVPAIGDSKNTRVQPGDLWQLGPHRIFCGDCTQAHNVARLLEHETPLLMVTDPPYGVEYDANWRNEKLGPGQSRSIGKVENDDLADWHEAWSLFPGSIAYVWHAALQAGPVFESLKKCNFEIKAGLVWTKPMHIIGRGAYHFKHESAFVAGKGDLTIEPEEGESAWYAVRKDAKAMFVGGRRQSTVWNVGYSGEAKTPHSTQKPVALFAKSMANHGKAGDAVYDPFLGSGTSIIAAHRTGRRCFGLELNPVYCDVILARWEALTGEKATRIDDQES